MTSLFRLGPPLVARPPRVEHEAKGASVLVPYVARQRLAIHRSTGRFEAYLPPRVYYGRPARHVEDRKRPNHFASLERWLMLRDWPAENYLFVASLHGFCGSLASPQELTKKSIEKLYRDTDYAAMFKHRAALLAHEVVLFCHRVTTQQLSIQHLQSEDLPALFELVVLERLRHEIADENEYDLKLRLATCQYLANQSTYDALLTGYLPSAVVRNAELLRATILKHGGQ